MTLSGDTPLETQSNSVAGTGLLLWNCPKAPGWIRSSSILGA